MMVERITLTRPWEPAADAPNGALSVVVMRAGQANGLHFPAAVLAEAVPLLEGVPSYVDHAGPADSGRPGGRSVRDLAGALTGPCYDADREELVARLRLYRQGQWIAELAAEAGGLPQLGVSAVLWVVAHEGVVRRIHAVESVDVVMNPAAGGRFLVAPEDLNAAHDERAANDTKGARTMATSNDTGEVQRVEAGQHGTAAPQPHGEAPPAPAPEAAPATVGKPGAEDAARADDAAGLREHVERLQMELALGRSGLPEEAQDAIRRRFDGQRPEARAVEQAIAVYRDAFARAAAQGTVRNLGRVSGMLAPLDRIALAVERLLGLPLEARHADAPRLSGIREAYDLLTGDWERRGVFRGDRVSLANANTATMAQVVANTLNKVLLRQFESRPRWWAPIAYEEDFSTLNDVRWITVGGFGDLDSVAEGDPYTEKTWDDYAEISTFQKRGNYIGLTLEMIDRDDVAAVRAIPRRLGHAAYRTLSAAVAGLFTQESGAGPLLADGERLFSAAHGNAGATALSAAAWQATVAAMFKQAEFHSGKRLGIRPRYCLVPIDLEKTALEVFTSDVVPVDGAFFRNVLQRSADSVVLVPDWTDATDWAAAADPADLEGVCIGYRFGRAPELFVADGELTGSMFTNDEMRIKCRFVCAVGIGDYRALYKHNVVD